MKLTIYNNACEFKNRLRLEYDRDTNKIILKPCCTVYVKKEIEPLIYDADYFIDNIDTCLNNYSNFNLKYLDKFYKGRCTNNSKGKKNRFYLCAYEDNKNIKTIELSIYKGCNLNCIMCDLSHNSNEKEINIYKKLMDYFCKQRKYAIIPTSLGEPFLFKKEMLDWIDNCSYMTVVTNGTLLDNNYIDKLAKYKNKLEIIVSIDSIKKETYEKIRLGSNFDTIVNTITKLNNVGLLHKVLYCVQNSNINEGKSIVDKWFLDKNITVDYLYNTTENDLNYYLKNWK